MVTVGLAVGRQAHDGVVCQAFRRAYEAFGELFAVRQPAIEGDAVRQGTVEEEGRDLAAVPAGQEVGALGEIGPFLGRFPVDTVRRTDRADLVSGQHDELYAVRCEHIERGLIDGGLRQPESACISAEPLSEVAERPRDLGVFVDRVAQGQDGVVVGLGQHVAVVIGREDALVGDRCVLFEPRQQGGPHVGREVLVGAHRAARVALVVEQTGGQVGCVALLADAAIPIGPGRRARLGGPLPGVRILT